MILPEGRSYELSTELLKGAIDIHVHAGPHLPSSPRRVDPFEAATQARDAGMRAIVYMDVFNWSNGTAWMVSRIVKDIDVYGGIILNTVFGGMNPRAVKTALYHGAGAKYVSFGAHSTYYQARREGHLVDGQFKSLADIFPKFKEEELSRCIRIPEGAPGKELDEILGLIADHPHVFLNTGHVSNDEAFRLIDLSRKYGIKKVLVASTVTKNLSLEAQKRAADSGAYLEQTLAAFTHTTPIPKTHYYVERDYISIDEGMEGEPHGGVKQVAEEILEVGAEHYILSTDFGVYTLPAPVEGFREFIACMLDLGVPVADVRTMTARNPAKLLGMEETPVNG